MGADTPPGQERKPETNFAVSLSGEDDEELRGYFKTVGRRERDCPPREADVGETSPACAPTSSTSPGW